MLAQPVKNDRTNSVRGTLVQNLPWPLFFKEGEFSGRLKSPFEKGGFRGIFFANGKCNFTETSIRKIQKLKIFLAKSKLINGTCS
jgi:hypothetical protein